MTTKNQAFIAGWLHLGFWLGLFIYDTVQFIEMNDDTHTSNKGYEVDSLYFFLYAVSSAVSLTSITFGILLLHGLQKMKKGCVRAYILWSRVLLCLWFFGLIRTFFLGEEFLILAAVSTACLVVNAILYYVIDRRYQSMDRELQPPPLINNHNTVYSNNHTYQ